MRGRACSETDHAYNWSHPQTNAEKCRLGREARCLLAYRGFRD